MTEFNPSEHNIPDVNSYLEKNPSQLQAVLDAEKAGKNRPTLVSALEEQASKVAQPAEPLPVTVAPADQTEPNRHGTILGKEYESTPERGYRVVK